MAVAPTPAEIYGRAEQEGRRRLSMPFGEQVATGFIAGVTIVFGIVALGVAESLIAPRFGGGAGAIAGALAFGIGVAASVLLLNVLYRVGVEGDRERDVEEAARVYFDKHGRWPDEDD